MELFEHIQEIAKILNVDSESICRALNEYFIGLDEHSISNKIEEAYEILEGLR